MFDGIEVPASAVAEAEAEIARVTDTNPGMARYDAIKFLSDSLASIIAEDAIEHRKQWQPRLDRYVHLTRLADAEIKRMVAVLAVPNYLKALDEHTAAACDTITKAATS